MHIRIFSIATALSLAIIATPSAEAAKGAKKEKRAERQAAMMLGRFDRDGNGSLDQKEGERAKRLFTALKQLDTDKNGDLSDSEIAAAKVEKPKGKGAGKRKGGKGKTASTQ
jgi:hypothetical protein